MVARSITERIPVPLGQAREHECVLTERFQRLEHPGVAEAAPRPRWRPVGHRDAVGHVGEGEPDRRFGAPGPCEGRRHGVEHRQGNGRSHALQEHAAG